MKLIKLKIEKLSGLAATRARKRRAAAAGGMGIVWSQSESRLMGERPEFVALDIHIIEESDGMPPIVRTVERAGEHAGDRGSVYREGRRIGHVVRVEGSLLEWAETERQGVRVPERD